MNELGAVHKRQRWFQRPSIIKGLGLIALGYGIWFLSAAALMNHEVANFPNGGKPFTWETMDFGNAFFYVLLRFISPALKIGGLLVCLAAVRVWMLRRNLW